MSFKKKIEAEDEMSQKTKEWLSQFTDWAMKLMIVGIFGFGYNMHRTQNEMVTQMALNMQSNEARVLAVEKDVQFIKANMVSNERFLDVLKRVEQQLTIVLLQSGIKQKIALVDEK